MKLTLDAIRFIREKVWEEDAEDAWKAKRVDDILGAIKKSEEPSQGVVYVRILAYIGKPAKQLVLVRQGSLWGIADESK